MNAKVESQSISMEFDLPHPPSKVWRALTEPELLGKWLMPTTMQPVLGTSFTFKTQSSPKWDGVVSCEVHSGWRMPSRRFNRTMTPSFTPAQAPAHRAAPARAG
jgi:hypothetical protein